MNEPEQGAEETLEGRIRGRVQGVGFRYFVYGEAKRLGLNGNVRNMPDGSVRVQARGPRAKLEELAERLRKGPPLARVERADFDFGKEMPAADGFTIAN